MAKNKSKKNENPKDPSETGGLTTAEACAPYLGSPSVGSALFNAQVRVGNAAAGGLWEQIIGTTVGHHTWPTVSGGFLDTGHVTVELGVELTPSGSLALWTVGSETLSATGGGYGQISNIGVRAEVSSHPTEDPGQEGNVECEWRDVTVTFYNAADESATLPFDATCSPVVSLINMKGKKPSSGDAASGPAASQQAVAYGPLVLKQSTVLFAPPTGFTAVRVIVSGSIRLRSLDEDRKYPPALGANQIIGKIYVWTT